MTFSQYLQLILNNHNLTQTEFARRSNLSKDAISQYILEKRHPENKSIFKIAFAIAELENKTLYEVLKQLTKIGILPDFKKSWVRK